MLKYGEYKRGEEGRSGEEREKVIELRRGGDSQGVGRRRGNSG